jgi:hypothetical protein
MRIAKNIKVRHDSERHNEPIFALQTYTLHIGEGCSQGNGLGYNRSWSDYANAFRHSRQFPTQLPVRELVRSPDGHHQTYLSRQGRRASGILKKDCRSRDTMLDEGADNRGALNGNPRTLTRLIRPS